MIHINLTPNTEEGWADKVLKTNLWPINLDTWAALKASENKIFFVEDDVEKYQYPTANFINIFK